MSLRIGQLDIPNALLLAPMEDVTDISFRLICKRRGADIVYTEFVNAEGLVRSSAKTHRKMAFLPEERPFGIQIYGAEGASMERAAQMAEELQPDIIDINCGCWVKKIVGHGAGAGLLRDLPKLRDIVSSVVRAVRVPVTVKTRLGWDTGSIRIVEVAKMLEDVGIRALTIHCRTRAQGHQGEPDYSHIPSVKQAVSIPIIVNGGIDSPEIAARVFQETGCDGVMIARGAIQNPWIFEQIKHYLETGETQPEPNFEERVNLMLEHLSLSVQQKGNRYGVLEFRKYYTGYLRSVPGVAKLRSDLMMLTEENQVAARVREFLAQLPQEIENQVVA